MPVNKRNGRKQEEHLEFARYVRGYNYKGEEQWNKNNGRKPKKEQVKELLKQYPNSSLRELEKISGISRSTIIKWKKSIGDRKRKINLLSEGLF